MTESTIEVSDQAKMMAVFLNNRGLEAAAVGDGGDTLHAGIAMMRRAVATNPLDLGCRVNLANFLTHIGEDDEAESLATFVLKHNEKADIAWQVLGVIATHRGRLSEAIDYFGRAQACSPNCGQYKFDLAAAYLRAGRWLEGWPWYEFRSEVLPKTGAPPDAPAWKGEPTGHLMIYPDQGYGDLILFSRFVPWAAERAKRVTFMVHAEMLALFHKFSTIPNVSVEVNRDPDAKFDHQICLASLPLVYGLTPSNIPPDPNLLWSAQGRLPGDGLRIGIAWQGNPKFPGDFMRSIPFRNFLPLAADPRNTVYSLQVGPAAAAIEQAKAARLVRGMSWQTEGEWTTTAGMLRSLDLVVTSCTGVAHLAGSLGVPSFVMLGKLAFWAWMHGRHDTPWYPHTRLFHQERIGDWSAPMKRIVDEIEGMHRRRALVGLLDRQHAAVAAAAGPYEPEVADVLRQVLKPGDCFVDVGANAGIHTKLGAELVGDKGKVFAFEPGINVLPDFHKATEKLSNVTCVSLPLSDTVASATFYLCADGSGGNALWDPAEFPTNAQTRAKPESVTLPTTTLDAYFSGIDWKPKLIKIDTEGAELKILQGAQELLSSSAKPAFIIAELHEFGLAKLGGSQVLLRGLMRQHGYSTFVLQPGKPPLLVDPAANIVAQHIINLLFATPEAVAEVWGKAETLSGRPETSLEKQLRSSTAPPASAIALKKSNGADPGAQCQVRG